MARSSCSKDSPPSWFTPRGLLFMFCVINMLNYVDRGVIASNGVNVSGRTCNDKGICDSGSGIQGAFNLNNFQDGVLSSAFMVGLLIASPIFASLAKSGPQIASVGACCLVGIICSGLLYIANAGDSRVVLGRMDRVDKEIKAVQLSSEHNASLESVREELQSLHPDDPRIVVLKYKVFWRVKGIIQISRSISDAYLKKKEFNKAPLLAKFRLPEPFDTLILKAEPAIEVQKINPEDQFLIFASDGLWEHLTNQEVVDMVQSNPRNDLMSRM